MAFLLLSKFAFTLCHSSTPPHLSYDVSILLFLSPPCCVSKQFSASLVMMRIQQNKHRCMIRASGHQNLNTSPGEKLIPLRICHCSIQSILDKKRFFMPVGPSKFSPQILQLVQVTTLQSCLEIFHLPPRSP